jgi:very-short-patch-repair endonuclease
MKRRKPIAISICQNKECNRIFELPYPSRKKTRKFCSYKCTYGHRSKDKGKKVILICAGCNKTFEVNPAISHRYNYCSLQCRINYFKKLRLKKELCDCGCGKEFFCFNRFGHRIRFIKGHFKTWNTGLTKETDKRMERKQFSEQYSLSKKKYFKEHPEKLEKLKEIARKIGVKNTSIEVKIQNFLKELNIEFFTHQYISEISHAYQCDILIHPQKNFMAQQITIIECDGDYWHGNPEKYSEEKLTERQKKQKEKDACRNEELKASGLEVIRLWETDINKMTLEDFKSIINEKLKLEEISAWR